MARRLPDNPADRSRPKAPHPPGPLGLTDELAAAMEKWIEAGTHSEQTLARMSETAERFTARLLVLGRSSFTDVSPHDAHEFISAVTVKGRSPELATQHTRRTALRTLYRTLRALGLADGDPTIDLPLPSRGELAARPLTDDEVTLCRASVQMTPGRWGSARCVAWALGEATAVSSEITAVTVADLDDPLRPTRVRLPGTRRHEGRTAALTDWGARVIATRVRDLAGAGPQTLLAYGGRAPAGGAKAQASVCNALRHVLDAAGLVAEADVRPSSLRHWAGRSAYDAGTPIEGVARLLGHRSLDAAAEDIALNWRTPTDTTGKDRA